ncbi:hypothetical protein LEP1GSC073_4308 [Leptospira noguchii str. Cascata]|nr:hypothetical protein LEP1GSC073_4308 [Leptospira noguchii str. Cascata]
MFQSTSFTNKGRNVRHPEIEWGINWFQSTSFTNKGRNKKEFKIS